MQATSSSSSESHPHCSFIRSLFAASSCSSLDRRFRQSQFPLWQLRLQSCPRAWHFHGHGTAGTAGTALPRKFALKFRGILHSNSTELTLKFHGIERLNPQKCPRDPRVTSPNPSRGVCGRTLPSCAERIPWNFALKFHGIERLNPQKCPRDPHVVLEGRERVHVTATYRTLGGTQICSHCPENRSKMCYVHPKRPPITTHPPMW